MKYSKPVKTPDGRYYVKISNDNDSRVMVQMNNVKVLTNYDQVDDVTFEFNDQAKTKVTSLEDDIVANAVTNSESWFGKELPESTLKSAFKRSDGDTINISKAKVRGQVMARVFDDQKVVVEDTDVTPGAKCDVMMELAGVWFLKKTYGAIWRIAQVKLRPVTGNQYPTDYLFQDDESSDDEHDDYIA